MSQMTRPSRAAAARSPTGPDVLLPIASLAAVSGSRTSPLQRSAPSACRCISSRRIRAHGRGMPASLARMLLTSSATAAAQAAPVVEAE